MAALPQILSWSADEERGYRRLQLPEIGCRWFCPSWHQHRHLQNGGVGLAPFHDWEGKIPADLKVQIQKASDGIKDGAIQIDLQQNIY
jgi:hypothetical protein